MLATVPSNDCDSIEGYDTMGRDTSKSCDMAMDSFLPEDITKPIIEEIEEKCNHTLVDVAALARLLVQANREGQAQDNSAVDSSSSSSSSMVGSSSAQTRIPALSSEASARYVPCWRDGVRRLRWTIARSSVGTGRRIGRGAGRMDAPTSAKPAVVSIASHACECMANLWLRLVGDYDVFLQSSSRALDGSAPDGSPGQIA